MAATEAQLTAYLLDELGETERLDVERRMLADEPFFEACAAAEDELIESYLANDLPRERRERFERFFLASQRRRERLEFMRTLVAALPEPAPAQFSLAEWLRNLFTAPTPARLAFVCSIVVIVALGIWWWRMPRAIPAVPPVVKNDPPVPPSPVPPSPNPPPPPPPEPNPKPEKEPVLAFTLTPGVRAAGRRLAIPERVGTVLLNLELDPTVGESVVRGELSDADGNIVGRWKKLTVRRPGKRALVTLPVAGKALKPGDYVVILSAGAESGGQTVASFSFGVTAK